MWRYSIRFPAQTDVEPFTDFLAEGHIMGVADSDVALLRGIGHEKSNRLMKETAKALSASGYKSRFHDCHARPCLSQAGCGEIGPDLCRAVRGSLADLKPVCLGQRRDFTRFHFRGKTRQRHHGCSE
jgi:hypothetical protein